MDDKKIESAKYRVLLYTCPGIMPFSFWPYILGLFVLKTVQSPAGK